MSLKKRSLRINGHATSIALEPEFWSALEKLARERTMPLSALIAEIDASRVPPGGLSSTLRVYVLLNGQANLNN